MLKANPQMLAWGLIGDATLTDELLTEVLARVRVFCPDLSESEVDGLRRELEATIGVTMSEGVGLRDQVWPPWLDDKRASINWRYWGAFKNQLASENLSNDVKRVLDRDTDNILDYCGNPGEEAGWRIRGFGDGRCSIRQDVELH
jgi:hypothetical protein